VLLPSILNVKLVCNLMYALKPHQLDMYSFAVTICTNSGGGVNQSFKIFLYRVSSFQCSLFVPSIDLSSIELSKLVRRPVPLLSLAESTKMQTYIPFWYDLEIFQLRQGFMVIRVYWVMISACLNYRLFLFVVYICYFRFYSVTVLTIL